jgi:CDP-4-dehydro-6-deoxyglucose reductase, E3
MLESSRPHRPVQLIDARPLSPTVRGMTFRILEGQRLHYVAGQWINLRVPSADGDMVQRAYSIASAPSANDGEFEIAVTRVENGPVSTWLHEVDVGAQAEIDGPWGFFTRIQAPPEPALFIGTGTGLAPLRAMLQEEVQQQDGPPLILLFGCRTQDDILWREELEKWAASCPRFHLEVTLSRGDPGWAGRRGYVQEHIRDLLVPISPAQVYICGLSKMVKDARRILKEELGYPRQAIHTERYD